jgi:uncharacterized protein (DUF924 family)
MDKNDASRVAALLAFWFGAAGTPECDQPRTIWFKSNPEFDAQCATRFGADQTRAAQGLLDHWAMERDAALALILLLDQMPRNLYRGTPAAFACDPGARGIARAALERGFDQMVLPIRRLFFYLPFEHSEELADQERSLLLYVAMPRSPDYERHLDSARRHHDIVKRFGRFPHRNRALGRATTDAEEAFLREPGSSF